MENGGRRGFQKQKEVIFTNNSIGKTGISPCTKCPYKLGIIKTLLNPCPQCEMSAYSAYKRFLKDLKKEKKE